MSERKELGRISSIRFGRCAGYQEAGFGALFTLEGPGWGVSDDWWSWPPSMEPMTGGKWTAEDRDDELLRVIRRIDQLLIDAKAQDITQLRGKPIEATFDGNLLKSWRVLTEVLP